MYTVQGKERKSVTIFKTFTVQCTVYWCSTVERCRRVPLLTFRAPLTVRAADRAENLAQLQESSIIVLVGKQIYNRKQLPLLRHHKALYSDQVIVRTAKHPFLDRESDIATTFHSFCLQFRFKTLFPKAIERSDIILGNERPRILQERKRLFYE